MARIAVTMTVSTFYDLSFRARHALENHSEAAAHPHWHSYTVRLWFSNKPDQDNLSLILESRFMGLHGSDLGRHLKDSTDENLAMMFLRELSGMGCVRVCVTNDSRRGAEASL